MINYFKNLFSKSKPELTTEEAQALPIDAKKKIFESLGEHCLEKLLHLAIELGVTGALEITADVSINKSMQKQYQLIFKEIVEEPVVEEPPVKKRKYVRKYVTNT